SCRARTSTSAPRNINSNTDLEAPNCTVSDLALPIRLCNLSTANTPTADRRPTAARTSPARASSTLARKAGSSRRRLTVRSAMLACLAAAATLPPAARAATKASSQFRLPLLPATPAVLPTCHTPVRGCPGKLPRGSPVHLAQTVPEIPQVTGYPRGQPAGLGH